MCVKGKCVAERVGGVPSCSFWEFFWERQRLESEARLVAGHNE